MNAYRLAISSCAGAIAVALATPAIAGELQGYVFDASDTIALEAAQVRIVELDRVANAQADGSFLFADIPAGTYTVVASYTGAAPVTQTVTVPATGIVRANFQLGGDDAQILVVGQFANQASALSRKRAADGVSDVLTRDAVGQFPDQNVAESLRRLPGVNILDDQGEGRFVSIRGLDPELNATSLNGVRLPAPESDVRSVALDVISSDTIESIEVKKSLTPDMDADTIGGSVEIQTTSPFRRRKDLLSVRLEGSYNDYSGKVTPKGSLDFSKRLGENIGISGGVSYYKREFETDNVETGGNWSTDGNGVDFSDEIQYRDYDVTRERINGSLSLDFLLSSTTTAYIRGNWSQFDDHEYRRRTTILLSEDPTSGDANSAYFSDADGRIEVRRDTKDRFERQRIRSIVVGSDTDTGEWKFNWSVSYAKSTEKEDFSLDPTRFRARFSKKGVGVNFDYSDDRIPYYTVTSGETLFADPAKYSFNRIELTDLSDSQDEEWAGRVDVARRLVTDGGEFTVQGGFKGRWRKKSYNFDLIYYGDYNGSYTLADVLGTQTYRLMDIGPVSSKTGPTDFYLANIGNFEVDQYETDLGSNSSDYSVSEDVSAGYVLGRWDSDTLRVIGGVRVERTTNTLNGNVVADDGSDVFVTPVSYRRGYTDYLPSLTLRFEPQPGLILRLAGSKSLVRPKLSKLAPRFTINEDAEAEFGNPDLLPYRAWNLDAGVEYYFSTNGAITAGAYYKDIKNFIVDGFFDATDAPYNGVYRGTTFSEALIPLNGENAQVAGFEASVSQAFTFLPSPFDGLLAQANYSYTWTEATLFDGRTIPLPAASRNTVNLVLGYEKGPFEFRAAGTYRSKYLDELGGSAEQDRYVDNHFQIDLSAKVEVTKGVKLFAEWINVNNAKYFAYQTYNGRQRLLQYEEYGPTVKFGLKATF
ncbi:MAG: TonB-dependent receptor [Sphingomonadales bacterium]|nr:TonB-dependent receptor [Sphingomonadales bacterium]MBD3772960.1 TonB-dependent receptor [Paracoccaceae bacterium]